jgi:hypothetical protein
MECLLPFGAESFVFEFVIQNSKYQDTQNNNFACCFIGFVKVGRRH